MKKFVLLAFAIILIPSLLFAWDSRPYKDFWGNRYKYYENLWKDSDGDGVINYFDYNDRDPYIQNPYQYSFPSYKRRLHLLPRYKRGYYWNYRYHPY